LKRVDEMNQVEGSRFLYVVISPDLGGPVFGVTKFSDLTPEEFKNTYLMKKPITRKEKNVIPAIPNAPLPNQFDWYYYYRRRTANFST
jgi:hypothetical protein